MPTGKNTVKVMTKKIILFILFFSGSPFLLAVLFLFLFGNKNTGRVLGAMVSPVSFVSRLYMAFPPEGGQITTEVKVEDGRCLLIEKYLSKYSSPLLPYSQFLCESAIKHNLDYRLMVAIAQQESNLCKNSSPWWHNCWGWGIHSKGLKTFESYPEAIETIARGIKENYCDKGYCEDPCLMMKKYTPNSNGSWCFGVKKFMEEIEQGY